MTRNVVITGGAGGLGRTMAALFLAQGDRVHVCDAVAAAPFEGHTADRFRSSVCDIGDSPSVASCFAEIFAWMPRVDVLINNVGIAGPRLPIEEIPEETWDEVLGANLLGAVRCLRQVLPGMKQARNGVVLNISTSSVLTRPLNRSPYTVSKAALEALTTSIARELGPHGVRCNAIRPGMMENERMFRVLRKVASDTGKSFDEVLQGELQFVSMRSLIQMNDVAQLAQHLCSDASRHVTGQCVAIDGGAEWES